MIDAFMEKDTFELAGKVVYTAGIVLGFWKGVDRFFLFLERRQRGFVADIVKEELSNELSPIRAAIIEIKSDREKDSRYQTQQFQKIMDALNRNK